MATRHWIRTIDCPRSLVLDLHKANLDILIGLPTLADLLMDEIANS